MRWAGWPCSRSAAIRRWSDRTACPGIRSCRRCSSRSPRSSWRAPWRPIPATPRSERPCCSRECPRTSCSRGWHATRRAESTELDALRERQIAPPVHGGRLPPHVRLHASEPDSRPPPMSFSPPKAPPISAPLVPAFTFAMPRCYRGCVQVVPCGFQGAAARRRYLPGGNTSIGGRVRSRIDNQRTVLVVDDHPELRVCLGHLLERAGYRILLAGNGAEGLE